MSVICRWRGCDYPEYTLAQRQPDGTLLSISGLCEYTVAELIGDSAFRLYRLVSLCFSGFCLLWAGLVLAVHFYRYCTAEKPRPSFRAFMWQFPTVALFQAFFLSVSFVLTSVDVGFISDLYGFGKIPLIFLNSFLPLTLVISYLFTWRRTLDELMSKTALSRDIAQGASYIVAFLVSLFRSIAFLKSRPATGFMSWLYGVVIFVFFLFNLIYGLRIVCQVHSTIKTANQLNQVSNRGKTLRILNFVILCSIVGMLAGATWIYGNENPTELTDTELNQLKREVKYSVYLYVATNFVGIGTILFHHSRFIASSSRVVTGN